MIITTTNSVEGRPIAKYLGIVVGETVVGANVFKDTLASMTDFFGGRSGSYEREFEKARNTALSELTANAQALGADAVVGVDLDYEVVGRTGSMLMVSVSGTAVTLR